MADHDAHHDRVEHRADDPRFRPDERPRLGPLSELDDFEVADGYPDPRGWHVIASDGAEIGEVHDLIVDTGTMHTRYLDVRLDHDHIPAAAGRPSDDWDVLIPIGSAQVVEGDEEVRLPSISPTQIVAFPVFNHGAITSEYENSVLAGVGATTAAGVDRAAERTAAERTAAERAVADHAANATAAPAATSTPISTSKDDVSIERRPVEPRDAKDAKITSDDNEVHIPLVTEETVTRPVVREEIVIKRHGIARDDNTTNVDTTRNP